MTYSVEGDSPDFSAPAFFVATFLVAARFRAVFFVAVFFVAAFFTAFLAAFLAGAFFVAFLAAFFAGGVSALDDFGAESAAAGFDVPAFGEDAEFSADFFSGGGFDAASAGLRSEFGERFCSRPSDDFGSGRSVFTGPGEGSRVGALDGLSAPGGRGLRPRRRLRFFSPSLSDDALASEGERSGRESPVARGSSRIDFSSRRSDERCWSRPFARSSP